jgi:hypothetical protein
MKLKTFAKACSATVVEVVDTEENNFALLATVDYLGVESIGKIYGSWYNVPEELKNRTVDFFTSGTVYGRDGKQKNGIRVYVK